MFTLNCNGRLLVAERPLVMGIINLTPDSFYEGSRVAGTGDLVSHTARLLSEGADIIDIGAQSTRPGATLLSEQEEMARISGVVDVLTDRFPEAFFSIDTFYSRVAALAVAAGASMINDVSGGGMDPAMIERAAELRVPYICTHMRGTPATMQLLTDYEDVTGSVLEYFIQKTEICRNAGINDLILDPGFGFSKNISQNFELLRRLRTLTIPGLPLLVGLSRKSTIYKTLGIEPADALNGTTALNTVALLNGASILRVHDAKAALECVTLIHKLKASS